MSFMAFYMRTLVQDMVYWGNPRSDGFGGYEFDPPVALKCRWEDANEIIRDNEGEEALSQARAWVTESLDPNGYVYLGTMEDDDYDTDVAEVAKAMRILSVQRVPILGSTTEFVTKIHVNMGGAAAI